MRAEVWAILTALSWGFGSLLEKRGVKIGHLTPIMGAAIRTAFSLVLLLILVLAGSRNFTALRTAGLKSILLIALGGGIIAGGLGLIFLYTGLKHGRLSIVMTIAFCLAPVVGIALGRFVLHEKLSFPQIIGMTLCIVGAAVTTLCKAP